MSKPFAVATRFFVAEKSRMCADQAKLKDFVLSVFACDIVETLYVAVNTTRDTGDTIPFLEGLHVPKGKRIVVLPVHQWGRYVMPLNCLLYRAAFDGYEELLFANAEHRPTSTNIDELACHLDLRTLVVGASLPVFHDFSPGTHAMDGMRVPADAFMLVRVSKLTLTGFVGVSEASWIPCMDASLVGTPQDPGMKEAGIKEVATFSFVQHILGKEDARVVLTPVTGAERDTSGIIGERKTLDDHKRQSARGRASLQMSMMSHLPYGIVHHIP